MMRKRVKIGIDIGGTKIAIIAMDGVAGDQVLYEDRVATPKGDYAGVIAAICGLVTGTQNHIGVPETDGISIGIGIPGSISPQSGNVQNANSTWMNGRNFQADITRALGQNVRLANDANCLALSEAYDGAAVDAASVFAVIIGTGCGGGLVVNRRLHTGRHAIAGEWGHTPLPWLNDTEYPAPACWCGRHGCLEVWVSGSGLERDGQAVTGNSLAAHQIAVRAEAGDESCKELMVRHCDRLARGLAMITNIVDPDVIVLGGGLSQLGHLYRDLPEKMKTHVFSDHFKPDIRPPVHGDASGVRGAARLWDEDP